MGGGTHTDGDTVSLELPSGLFAALEKESKRKRKSVVRVLADFLEDQADYRAAEAVMKRVREGKEKLIPAEEVYKRLGLR
jgi:predicted DNA-binding protein